MKRINLYLEDSLYDQIKNLPGTITKHVTIALHDYLKNLEHVASSQSKRKEDK